MEEKAKKFDDLLRRAHRRISYYIALAADY
jgi:hypothetical protein